MRILLTLALLALPATVGAVIDDYDIDGGDIAVFEVGEDVSSVGSMHYIVDRTAGLCFVRTGHAANSTGLTHIPCEPLKAYPAIKAFIESGKRP